MDQGIFDKALKYSFDSLNIKIHQNMKLETARTCSIIGGLYTVMKQYETAAHYGLEWMNEKEVA